MQEDLGYISQHGFSDKKEALIYASAIASYTVSDFGINKLLNLNLDTIKSRVDLIKNIMKNKPRNNMLNYLTILVIY